MELVKEETKTRSLQDINKEYSMLCYENGSREYKIRVMKQEIEQNTAAINALDIEAAALALALKAKPESANPEVVQADSAPPEPVTNG